MPAVSQTLRGTIPAAIDRVFAALTEPTNIPQWLPGCDSVELVGAMRRGARLKARFGGRVVEFEIIEYTPPNNFGWVERQGRIGHKFYINLAFGGGSTTLTLKDTWQPHGLRAWLLSKWHRRRNAKRTFEGLMNNLRTILDR